MQEWVTIAAVVGLWLMGVATVVASYKSGRNAVSERQDMLDRLMSKDLTEYKDATAPIPEPSAPVSMSEEEEWMKEIELMNSARGGIDRE